MYTEKRKKKTNNKQLSPQILSKELKDQPELEMWKSM